MNWLFLVVVAAYILLSDVALAACRRKPHDCTPSEPISVEVRSVSPLDSCEVCGLTRRRTRLYDDDVYEIVVWDRIGHQYCFIFTQDRMPATLIAAMKFAANSEYAFGSRLLSDVAHGLDDCRRNCVGPGQGKST